MFDWKVNDIGWKWATFQTEKGCCSKQLSKVNCSGKTGNSNDIGNSHSSDNFSDSIGDSEDEMEEDEDISPITQHQNLMVLILSLIENTIC